MNITKELRNVLVSELEKRFDALNVPMATPKPPASIATATAAYHRKCDEYEAARSALQRALNTHQWMPKAKNHYYNNGRKSCSYYEASLPSSDAKNLIMLPRDFTGITESKNNWVDKKYDAIAVKLQYGKSIDVESLLKEIRSLTL